MTGACGRGLLIAAPSSGSGKTTITLGILAALARRGHMVRGAKSGPDYIDPQFHSAATGRPCVNLDAWSMSAEQLRAYASGPGTLIVEGAMGLFDGAADGSARGAGSSADLARTLGCPVVLVVDASKTAHSVAALVAGFAGFDPEVEIAGLILNRVGSPKHTNMLRHALAPLAIPVLGAVPRDPRLATPSRHLGLVQAQERTDLEAFLDLAAIKMAETIDLDQVLSLARPLKPAEKDNLPPAVPPLGQRIAVAQDAAFGFAYTHALQDWRNAGAEVLPFSPLADNAVPDSADAVFLPGGYPELHAGQIASAEVFLTSLRAAAARATPIYGECGGYMVLGDGLIDADGNRHAMSGLLRLETSFAQRKLHLGYRDLKPLAGPFERLLKGHEFHYASTLRTDGAPLFAAQDAGGKVLPEMGLHNGTVFGSFAHVICGV